MNESGKKKPADPKADGRRPGKEGVMGGGALPGVEAFNKETAMRYLILALLAGCAPTLQHVAMDYNNPPPADWPKLREHVYNVPHQDLARYCRVSAETATKAVSCAVINFTVSTCSIYITEKALPESLQHERDHCLGYNHVGDLNRSRNAWERWKKANGQ